MATVFLHSVYNVVLSAKEGLQNDIIASGPEKLHVNSDLFEMLAEGSKRPLKTEIILAGILVLNKLFIFLVKTVVGEMHASVIFVDLGGVSF